MQLDLENTIDVEKLKQKYTFNKIIYYNSCGSTFLSLELNKNTFICGKNGLGKTSKMNGVQICILPHMTFNNIEKNFYFQSSKNKSYKAEETYDLYFPHKDSYIISEIENPDGVFCQIIYQGNKELSINRAFVPLAFKDIYNWFWTLEDSNGNTDSEGIGYPTGISPKSLVEKIKSVNGYRIATNKKEASSILYHNINDSLSDNTFSILSIPEEKQSNVLDIFKLSTNASTIDNNMIKKIIISIIETGYKNNSTDVLDVNISDFVQEMKQLEDERKNILLKRSFEDKFQLLLDEFDNIKSLSNQLKEVTYSFIGSYKHHEKHLDEEITTKTDNITKYNNIIKQKEIESKSIQEKLNKLKENKALLKGTIQSNQNNLDKYHNVLNTYHKDLSTNNRDAVNKEISDLIKERINKGEEIIKEEESLLSNEDDKNKAILKNNKEISYFEEKLTKFKNEKEKHYSKNKNYLLNDERLINSEILSHVNNQFNFIPEINDKNVIDKINGFLSLFSIENNKLFFCHHFIKNIVVEEKLSLEDIETGIEESLIKIEQLKESNNLLSSKLTNNDIANIKSKILKYKTTINELKNQESFINLYGTELFKNSILDKNKEIDEVDNKINHMLKDKENIDNENSKLINNKSKLVNELHSVESLKYKNEKNLNSFNNFRNTYGYKIELNEVPEIEENFFSVNVNESQVKEIENILISVKEHKIKIKNNITDFIHSKIIEDKKELNADSDFNINSVYKSMFADIQKIYISLDEEEKSNTKRLKDYANASIGSIRSIKSQIDNYKDTIASYNKKLSEINLSSIMEMRLNIKFEKRIESFIKQMESFIDFENGQQIDCNNLSVYLQAFINEMDIKTTERSFRINANKMISSIDLEYFINNRWESKDGSTGTSAITSIMLLVLFIREICGDYISLSIPINLDEIGSIDDNNLENIISFVKSNNLTLFSASPSAIESNFLFDVQLFLSKMMFSYNENKDRLLSPENNIVSHYCDFYKGDIDVK